jgi:carboxymethylenebutenolidase
LLYYAYVTIKSFAGEEFDAYMALPASGYGQASSCSRRSLVNSYIRSVADWYAAHGFVALCPDLFWRIQRGV